MLNIGTLSRLVFATLICGVVSQVAIGAPLSVSQVQKTARSAINLAFGDQRADIHRPNMRLAEAVIDSFSRADGVDDMGSTLMISGCRIQSCEEKGAAILDKGSGRLLGAGILHFRCHFLSENKSLDGTMSIRTQGLEQCDRQPTFDLFVMRSRAHAESLGEEAVVRELTSWGKFRDAPAPKVTFWSTR